MPKRKQAYPELTQAQEIALLKKRFLQYYQALPIKKAGADYIGRTLDTINDWEDKDPSFAEGVLRAKAEYARKHGKTRPASLLPKLYDDFKEERQEVEITTHDVKNPSAIGSVLSSLGLVRAAGSGDQGTE